MKKHRLPTSLGLCAIASLGWPRRTAAAAGGIGHGPQCRVALCYSGHVRSFVHPRVHLSHMNLLIQPLKDGGACQVDIFMYLSVEDEVPPSRRKMGEHANLMAFDAYTPEQRALDPVLKLFEPVSVVYHQEQAGYLPSGCPEPCKENTYWQLYKMAAVHRMMVRHEETTGLPYTWVVRSRLDIGWMLPLPPLRAFLPDRVYVGHNYFPLNDQFALVPRAFSDAFFGAIRLCFVCDVLRPEWVHISAQTELLLWEVLHAPAPAPALSTPAGGDAAGAGPVPYAYYEFPFTIVRYHEGGVCHTLHPHKLVCPILQNGGLFRDGWDTVRCMDAVNDWHRETCRRMFPPLVGLDDTPAAARAADAGAQVGAWSRGGSHEETPAKSPLPPPPLPPTPPSFATATAELTAGARRRLWDLSRAVRVRVRPAAPGARPFYLAHHYPYTWRGEPRMVSVLSGAHLSEADFDRVALAFACELASFAGPGPGAAAAVAAAVAAPAPGGGVGVEAGAGAAAGGWGGEEEGGEGGLVLGTVPGGEVAEVNCSAVTPVHGVWMQLLRGGAIFEPPEPFCLGELAPCWERLAGPGWADAAAAAVAAPASKQ